MKLYEQFSLVDCVTSELAKAGADPLALGKYIDIAFLAAAMSGPNEPAEALEKIADRIQKDLERINGARKDLQERNGRQERDQAPA